MILKKYINWDIVCDVFTVLYKDPLVRILIPLFFVGLFIERCIL